MRLARSSLATAALFVGAALAAACSADKASSAYGAGGTGTGTGGAGGSAGASLDADLGIDAENDAAPASDACGSVLLGASAQPGNVVVVFDQSNSMGQKLTPADGGAPEPKWAVARDALAAAVAPLASSLRLGAVFFPSQPAPAGTNCGLVDEITASPPQIALSPGAAFLGAWSAHFSDPAWTTILSTPLVLALQRADAALADPFPLSGPRVVVVLTDGAPTCDTNHAHLLAPVQAMAARGIQTWVIGLPGSATAATLLDDLAAAGGSGHYLSPADPAALTAALVSIARGVVDPCTLTLSPAAPDPSKVWLYATDAASGAVSEILASEGWSVSADGATATLTGALCDRAKQGAFADLQFVFGCPLGATH